MKKLNHNIKQQILALSGQVLPALIGMVSFMLLVRFLEPNVLGEFLIYMTTVILFEMVKSGGMQAAIVMRVATSDLEKRKTIVGSAYFIGLMVVMISSAIMLIYNFTFGNKPNSGFEMFCLAYSVLGFITLPLHIAEAEAVAAQDLSFLLKLRLIQSGNPLMVALAALLGFNMIQNLVLVHVLYNLALLVYVVVINKTNPIYILQKTKKEVIDLLHLIKYTLATLGTTNVLKSADTFLIGAYMGPTFVALYAVPMKLTELFEIPLRTLSTTAFPELAANYNAQDKKAFTSSLLNYIVWSYLIYVPALILAFVLAPFIVKIIGGSQYQDTYTVFRVFVIYGLFLPMNRITGICLDALQVPKKNFIKVMAMAIINILADIIAIYVTKDLHWIAAASILNAASGAYIGWIMVKNSGFIDGANLVSNLKESLINNLQKTNKFLKVKLS